MISGAAADILWLMFLTETGIYEMIPGFICSLAVAVIASKITGEPPKEVKDIFDTANADDFDE